MLTGRAISIKDITDPGFFTQYPIIIIFIVIILILIALVVYLKYYNINTVEEFVIEYLSKNHSITSKKLAKLQETSKPTAVKLLNKLIKKDLIKRIGKTRGSYYSLKK